MTALAPTLEAYFTQRLIGQRQASPNTVATYRDAWRLLLGYTQQRTGRQPYQLDIADLDAALIGEFLNHLETHRHNSVRTRNARLAAIRSFFAFAALRHPEHAQHIARVLTIPPNAATGPSSPTSTTKKLTPWWPAPTAVAGPAGVTMPCSLSPCKRGCGSPN
jgi:site-specific recombinase XerD